METGPCATAKTCWLAAFNGVSKSVPPCRLLAFAIDDTTASSVIPGFENGGSLAVTMTDAMFLVSN
jgi:hypothetical protein